MKYILLLLFALPTVINAQQKLKPTNSYKITYWRSADGKPKEDRNPVILIASSNQNLITTASIFDGNGRYPFEQSVIEKPSNILFQIADLNKTTQIATADSTAISKQVIEVTNETKVILGYTCKKATTVVNSNRIDLWFTTDAGIKAAPTVLGQNLGLVLEQVRNGNSYLTATSINEIKAIDIQEFKEI